MSLEGGLWWQRGEYASRVDDQIPSAFEVSRSVDSQRLPRRGRAIRKWRIQLRRQVSSNGNGGVVVHCTIGVCTWYCCARDEIVRIFTVRTRDRPQLIQRTNWILNSRPFSLLFGDGFAFRIYRVVWVDCVHGMELLPSSDRAMSTYILRGDESRGTFPVWRLPICGTVIVRQTGR